MAVWECFTNQKQWKEYLQNLLKVNDNALLKAVVLIYENQTDEEKLIDESFDDNHLGFSKFDAKEMSCIARKIKKNKSLTEDELAKSRNKMPKYWRQLMIISKKQINERNLQEQKRLKIIEELENELEKEKMLRYENFKEHNEMLRKCAEEGKACEYGICDECMLERIFRNV